MKRWSRIILEVSVTCGVVFGLFWLTNEILLKGRCGASRLVSSMLVGGTIGPVLSLVLIDRLVYRSRHWNWQGTLITLLLGFAGFVVSLKLVDMDISFLLWNVLSLAAVTVPPIAGFHFFLREEAQARGNGAEHDSAGPDKFVGSEKELP